MLTGPRANPELAEAMVPRAPRRPLSGGRPGAPLSVLLTGGPAGGKSSALAALRQWLAKAGYHVTVVPESATMLLQNSGGVEPAWREAAAQVRLQRLFLQFQLAQEETYRRLSELRPGKAHVILHDRGCLDGRLVCSARQWSQVLDGVGLEADQLLQRYDVVIHLTTVASGMEHLYEFGPGSSNPARYQTPEEARRVDELAQEVYGAHPRFFVAPNFPHFGEKLGVVVRCIADVLHERAGSDDLPKVPEPESSMFCQHLDSAISAAA